MADNQHEPKHIKHIRRPTSVGMPVPSNMVVTQVNGFSEFLREYGVVALAVGFVFGAQVKAVVDQFTASIINPLLGLILPGTGNLAQKSLVIHGNNKLTVFAWGALVETLISFIIIAALIYLVVKAFKLDKLTKKK
jgi:large conductance mechanosensitive channel